MSFRETKAGYVMTIYVGSSRQPIKEIKLPYRGMYVQPIPCNLTEKTQDMKFETDVFGHTLTLMRKDVNRGWNVDLTFKAYYSKEVTYTHEHEFEIEAKGEGSAVTIRLEINQKIRCFPQFLLFKDDSVVATATNIDISQNANMPAVVRGLTTRMRKGSSSNVHSRPTTPNTALLMTEYCCHSLHGDFTFGAEFPKLILHINLAEFGRRITFRRGTLVAASTDITMAKSLDRLDAFQYLIGEGEVFLQSAATIQKMTLKENENTIIREDLVVAYTQDIVSRSQSSIDAMESSTLRKMTGPGVIWVNHSSLDAIAEDVDEEDFVVETTKASRLKKLMEVSRFIDQSRKPHSFSDMPRPSTASSYSSTIAREMKKSLSFSKRWDWE